MKQIPLMKKGPKAWVEKANELITAFNNLTCAGGNDITTTATATGWVVNYTKGAKPTTPDPPATNANPGGNTGGGGGSGVTALQAAILNDLANPPNPITLGSWTQQTYIDSNGNTVPLITGWLGISVVDPSCNQLTVAIYTTQPVAPTTPP